MRRMDKMQRRAASINFDRFNLNSFILLYSFCFASAEEDDRASHLIGRVSL